jgi:hypothetical protein
MTLLEKLRQEMLEAQARYKAAQEFADLEEVKDKWGVVRLTASFVNEIAVHFEVHHECDCCSGAKVYALPYIDFEDIRLYSSRLAIAFAKRYFTRRGFIYVSRDDWDDGEEWDDFSPLLLDKIAEWLDEHDADEEEEDYSFMDNMAALDIDELLDGEENA